MANSILKLKVENEEYDAKLKKAAEGIRHLAEVTHKAGGDLTGLDKAELAYIKALGDMETKSRTAAGSTRELESAFKELTVIYNRLNDEEKADEGGKALAASLEKLKQRAIDARAEMDGVNKELSDTKSSGNDASMFFDELTNKLGVNIKAFVGFAAASTAAATALEIAKRTIDATESSSDALATTQMQLNSTIDSFFRNLNDGSFDNFLTGLSDVAKAARDAYQAMDELSSFAVRYNPKNAADLREIDKLMKEARALTAQGKKDEAQKKIDEAKAVAEQAKKNTLAYGQKEYDAGIASLRSLLGGTGVQYTEQQLAWYSDPANWDEIKRKANEYKEIQRQIDEETNRTAKYNPLTRTYDISDESKEYIRNRRAAITPEMVRSYNYLNTRDTAGTENGDAFIKATGQIYGKKMAEYAVDELNARIEQRGAMIEKSGGGGGKTNTKVKEKIVTGSMADLMNDLKYLQQEQTKATDTKEWETYQDAIRATQMQIKELKGELSTMPSDIAGDYLKDAKKRGAIPTRESIIAQGQAALKNFKGVDLTPEKNDKNFSQEMRKLTSGISQITGGLKAMGFKLPEEIDQAIGVINGVTSVIEGVNTVISVFGNTAMTANTAALVANTTALYANTAIPSIFAGGGVVHAASGYMVPGNSFSGDNVPALLNSGEVVLNKAQAGVLAHELQGGGMKDIKLSAKLAGGDIILSIDRTLMVQGKGQMATFK